MRGQFVLLGNVIEVAECAATFGGSGVELQPARAARCSHP